ncbi:conserved hypothetical protein [Candidatus Desulfarcum epimagneticum]|uniref:TIGR04255 family protein n=1 Tax=uncultured Desulfobacteraceae bacterium TaxID=218296 RepID=A0A484HFP3_9BACT|nr:conserved hypothetical protein [uncultured Desulfobacteraceae bacterium]
MKNHNPEIQGLSIVFIGTFNPKIFSPLWFSSEKLIRKQEAEQAQNQLIHPDVVSFNLDWLALQVTRDRFSAGTTKEPYEEILRDLVLGTFKLLRHTPLTQMGINWERHFRIDSVEKWHRIGHALAPKNIWNNLLDNPGLTRLSIGEAPRRDGLKGKITVGVAPSPRVQPGIFIDINDHVEVQDTGNTLGADEIINVLENRWEDSSTRSNDIISGLLERLDDHINVNEK